MAMFSHCKKAELTNPATGQKVFAGVSVGPLDSLMIATPLSCKVESNKKIEIKFLEPALGVVTCLCKLTAPLLSKNKKFIIYRCTVLKRLSQEQRREDIKIPLTTRVIISLVETQESAPATLCNISAGGVYLGTALLAQEGNQFTFKLPANNTLIPLTAEILRVDTRADLGGLGYGCRFVHLGTQHEAQLRSFIFKEERRLYKKAQRE